MRRGRPDSQHRIDHDHSHSSLAPLGRRGGELPAGLDDFGRVAHLDVGSDKPKARRADDGRYDGRPASAQHVHEEDVVDDRGHRLYQAVDSGGEELVRGAGDAEVVEDLGRVVIYGVCSEGKGNVSIGA